jgi:hypothetical protein
MKIKRYIIFRTVKALFKLGLVLIQAMISIGIGKPEEPQYTALEAEVLYDAGLIDEVEHGRSTHVG